jgi:hypothetical protein
MVNISPPARWHVLVHLCHRVSGSPGRPHLVSDLLILQRLAEPAAAPAGRAGGPEKWHKVAVFAAFFEHPYTGVLAPHSFLSTQHSALSTHWSAIGHRSGLGTVHEQREGRLLPLLPGALF